VNKIFELIECYCSVADFAKVYANMLLDATFLKPKKNFFGKEKAALGKGGPGSLVGLRLFCVKERAARYRAVISTG